jgi:hypothetical protein
LRKKEEILNRIKDLEEQINLDKDDRDTDDDYNVLVGKIKALNWVLNPD